LEGNVKRSIKILDGLQLEGVEPIYLNSMLAREIRSLSGMAFKIEQGQTPDAVMRSARVWDNRKGPVGACLQRHGTVALEQMQLRLGAVDRMVKGLTQGSAWDELTSAVLDLSSQRAR
jgi:DNA polymerase-3 subunit delta